MAKIEIEFNEKDIRDFLTGKKGEDEKIARNLVYLFHTTTEKIMRVIGNELFEFKNELRINKQGQEYTYNILMEFIITNLLLNYDVKGIGNKTYEQFLTRLFNDCLQNRPRILQMHKERNEAKND